MRNKFNPKTDPSKPTVYKIRIKGQLDSQWTDWFEGLAITLEEDGDTLLTGLVIDQAALHGLLKKIRDLGIPLVSVCPLEPGRRISQMSNSERNSIPERRFAFEPFPAHINPCEPGSDHNLFQVQFNQAHPYRSKKEKEMNTNIKTVKMDTKILLVILWVFYSLNFMYADTLSKLEPGALEGILSGYVADGTVKITAGFLLGTAIIWEIPFLMIVLSWVLKYWCQSLGKYHRRCTVYCGSNRFIVSWSPISHVHFL